MKQRFFLLNSYKTDTVQRILKKYISHHIGGGALVKLFRTVHLSLPKIICSFVFLPVSISRSKFVYTYNISYSVFVNIPLGRVHRIYYFPLGLHETKVTCHLFLVIVGKRYMISGPFPQRYDCTVDFSRVNCLHLVDNFVWESKIKERTEDIFDKYKY